MSWLRVDDGFPMNPKVLGLKDPELALWLRAGCWASRPENAHTNGFIPSDLLPDIARKPRKVAEALAAKLVAAKAGGTKQCGLWEEIDEPDEVGGLRGWQIHDWDDYRPSPEPMTPREAASVAGKRSAAVRRDKNGTAQPQRPPRTSPNVPEQFGERSTERPSEDVRPNEAPNEHRTSRTPDPVPDPVPDPAPPLQLRPGDVRSSGRVVTAVDVACPPDLAITDAQFDQLEISRPGITREFVATATAQLRGRFMSQDARPLARWRGSLFAALASAWTNPAERDRLLGTAPPPPPTGVRRTSRRVPIQPDSGKSAAEFLSDFGPNEDEAEAKKHG